MKRFDQKNKITKKILLVFCICLAFLEQLNAENIESVNSPSENKCPQGQYVVSDQNVENQKIVCQQSENVLQDPRCDDQFIKNLFAKNRCIDGNDSSACAYLVLAGIGAFAGTSISSKLLKNNAKITRANKFLKTHSQWAQRGVHVGVPIGIGLAIGLILPGIEFAIDYKTQKCAKEIGLTNELELKLVLPHLRKLGSASPCQHFQIENNVDFLGELKNQFGFIPKGACELALKKNQYYDKVTTDISFTKTNCNKISHKDYSLDLTTKEFRCRGNSGYEYVAKTNDKNYPDWDSLVVYYNGDVRPNLKLNFINNFQIKSSIFATSHDVKPDNIKNSRSRCLGSSDNSDYCKCIRGATIAQIIANSHLGLVCNEKVTDYQIDEYQKQNGIK